MLRTPLFCLAVAVVLLSMNPTGAQSADWRQPSLGINFAGPVDWNTELPFVDVFRFSRRWISQRQGASWGQGPELKLDEHGWVTRLESGCWAETPLCTIDGGHYPSGQYTVFYEGDGALEFGGAGRIAEQSPGQLTVDVDSSKGPIWLRIRRTDPEDYVRNIHVIMPGFAEAWRENPWHPDFLARWKEMTVFRAMDWQHTNGSTIATRDDFPTLDDAAWTEHGLPIEVICDFANRTGIDPWFCVPHRADDDAVRWMAHTIRQHLAPDRRVFIEYSNEVWNGQFAQAKYAGEKGIELKFADKPWEAGWKYTAFRSKEIFAIFEQEFGGTERLVRILPSQAANPYVAEQVVSAFDAWKSADALAIAPYFSMNTRPDDAAALIAAGVDGVLDKAQKESLPQAAEWIRGNKQVADKYKLQLVAYEAGQHFVGIQGAENNEQLTALLLKVNQHPRMYQLYTQYYDQWEQASGGVMCVFSSTGGWSKWGSWGLMQHADDNPADYPKMQATLDWVRKHNPSRPQ